MIFQAEAMTVAPSDTNCGSARTVPSAEICRPSHVYLTVYTASVGAPTAGATDVKAGKPDSQSRGINGALTSRLQQSWPFKC